MLFTIGLVIILVFALIMLGRNNGDRTIDRTLEIVDIDEDDTQTLRKLIRPHR